ncbi:MAG: Ig-like domain repeat protein, partial [Candidatus Acinetobacter avistercoris]|nr:Ig-like domain repeat protein [Candidatus Acinetobacter avistercoris]
NDKTPEITGTTEAGTTVTVVVRDKDGNVVATGPATVTDKTWTYTPSADLKDGDYTVTAEAKDKAGNTGTSKPVTFEVDTVAPDVSIDDLKPTNDTTPTISGKTEPSAKIAVVITDETGKIISEGQATVNPDGTWSYTPPTPLPEGDHKIEVTPSDKAGNQGSKVIAPLVIDTTPPDDVTIDPIGGDDFESNDSKPKIDGQGEPNSKVDIIITGPDGFEEKVTVPVDDKGNWTHTPTADLKEGDYKIIVTPIDEAGNKGNTTEQEFSIDLTDPEIDFDPFEPVIPFVGFDDLNSDGELAFDEVIFVKSAALARVADPVDVNAGPVLFANDPSIAYTNNPQRTFAGPSKDANVITVVFKNAAGQIVDSGFADIKGDRWSYTPKQPLVEGIYTVEIQAKDKAGNTSKPAIQKFGVDITAPDLNINELKPTNDATPLISGKTEANTTVKVEIKDGNGVTVDTGTAVVDGSGNWTYVPPANIKDGNYTVQATSTDSAKNQTTASQKLTIDTVAPGLVVINPVVQTGNLKPALTGTAEANAIVDLIIKDATGRVIDQAKVQVNPNGSWSYVPTKDLPEGTILVEAKATDKAGNTGQTSSTSFILDITPPDAPTANFNADGSLVNGTAQPLSTVKIKDASGNVIGTAVAANNGQYSIKLSPSLNDAQKVSVTATDLAGESPAKFLTAPNILVDAVDNVAKAEIEWSYPVQTNTKTDAIKYSWFASLVGLVLGQKSGETTITIKETTDLQVLIKSSAIGAIFQSVDYRFLKKEGNNWVDLSQSKTGGIFDFFGIFPNRDGFTAKGLEPGEYLLQVSNKNAAALFGNISVDLISTTKNTFGEAKIDNVKSIDGNVITDLDPVFGKDLVVSGAVVKAVNGVVLNGLTSVKGEYGTLSIQSNGSYTYKPNSDLKAIGKTDVFNYTITDPVTGKSDTASLVVQIDSKSGGALAWSKFTPEANANDAQALANESAGKFNSTYLNETVSANGLDKLIFNVLNKNSQNGGNGVDTINDFKLGSNVKIDVSDLLSDDATSQNLNKFIFVEKDGNNTKLSIDRDGTGTTFSKVELITFNNTDVSLQELLNKNHLLF